MTKTKTQKSLINIFLTRMKIKGEKNCKNLHISVLLQELVDHIKIYEDQQNIIVDCTLGMGGHAREILKKLHKGDIFIGFDADTRNLDIVKPILQSEWGESGIKLFFINDNFGNIRQNLIDLHISSITGIYYDLGISSLHIDQAERGFSFQKDGPLDMRFDTRKGITASQIVNTYTHTDLIRVFREYGEDSNAKRIADEIIFQRKKAMKFTTTKQLADLVEKISPFPQTKSRIFQALRIETNKELVVIEKSIFDAINLLTKGGNIFIISFHSLEDRIIKNIFRQESRDCICTDIICSCKHTKQLRIITKKPLLPSQDEIRSNPRSRSAKARCAIKI